MEDGIGLASGVGLADIAAVFSRGAIDRRQPFADIGSEQPSGKSADEAAFCFQAAKVRFRRDTHTKTKAAVVEKAKSLHAIPYVLIVPALA